jgi:hypothetical protein
MKLFTKFELLTPFQRTDSTPFLNTCLFSVYMHANFTHLFFSACVWDSLSYSQNVSAPSKNCATCMKLFLVVHRVCLAKVVLMGFPFIIYIRLRE